MGVLAGFRYREITKRLKRLGLVFHRFARNLVQSGAQPLHHHPQPPW
jgi:hypothetical protein